MTSFERYFARCDVSRNWFDIVDPSVVGEIATVDIGRPEYLSDRQAIKAAFKAFGEVENRADGSRVVFPAASAGKMLYQSGVDIHGLAAAFKPLFETSVRVWNEREVPMEGHKFHFNVTAYRNYLNKFTDGEGEYYIRFTVREIGKDSAVHASTISEVAICGKNEGTVADSHPENPEDGHKVPFTDNKIAFYLGYVNGVRRPVTMIVAESAAWCYTTLVALVFFAQVFDRALLLGLEGILFVAFLAWRIFVTLLMHYGKRVVATVGMSIEWILWAGTCRDAESISWFLVMSSFLLLVPSALLWLPASGRWIGSRKR